jgi:hypothetical protein
VTTEVHEFFEFLCRQYLELEPKLIKRLWSVLYPGEVSSLIVQAELASRWKSPGGIVRLAGRIPPKLLLDACQRLAPVDGRRRDKAVVEAEEAILRRVGADGRWA